MSPNALEALRALSEQEVPGMLTERGEFVMDRTMSSAVRLMAAEVGGMGKRGAVIRRLIAKGARAEYQERMAKLNPQPAPDAPVTPEVDPVEAAREAERAKRRERDRRRKERLAQEAGGE